jgi:fatty-acyl-CoA synthase
MPTIGGAVVHNARRVPNRVALVADEQQWTWAELDGMVARAAARLRAARLCAGDRFAMVVGNTAAGVIAYFAAARLGAIIVPVNARLAAPEIAHLVRDAGATIVASAPDLDAVVDTALADGKLDVTRFTLGETGAHANLVAQGDELAPVHEDCAAETDDALIVVTPREGHEPDLESLRAYCRSRIADYKLPREMHIAAIPRTPSGKVQKHLIKQALEKET